MSVKDYVFTYAVLMALLAGGIALAALIPSENARLVQTTTPPADSAN